MGREVRRVPLDFDHPVGETWPGFLNPHYKQCDACDGRGSTEALDFFDSKLRELLHAASRLPELRVLVTALCGRDRFALYVSDAWAAKHKILEAAGLPTEWGWCAKCGGDGVHPDVREAHESWEATAPPAGDGWQMWETTSEGSPISPVFATPEELARWLADTGASTFGAGTATYEEWLAMIGRGWAMSAVMTPEHGFESGVSFVARKGSKSEGD